MSTLFFMAGIESKERIPMADGVLQMRLFAENDMAIYTVERRSE